MDSIASWIVISVVVERLVEVISRMFPFLNHIKIKLVDFKLLLSLILGIFLSFGASLNFFSMFGIEFKILYVGEIISAIFIAAGSNYVHDIVSYLSVKRKETQLDEKLSLIKKELDVAKEVMSLRSYRDMNKTLNNIANEITDLKMR